MEFEFEDDDVQDELIIDEEHLIMYSNGGVICDLVQEAMKKDPIPKVNC